ncbi:hypothetical protein HU200_016520 [Digitaria exilis]|uniref:Uncharacterized protein n=1 Tax=Digitaria exilis TaxID=1010633 RepID=A0A835F7P6_9POAL|nr:hypothetical protein HU200_016520 [Digitaria exilis]
MDGGYSSPVMTDSERRAYRYGHPAAPRLRGMRKSWSNDSLAGYGGGGGRASCVCAPTTHPGSFRCKHHRHGANPGASAAAQVAGAPAPDAKHHEHEPQEETAPTAYQADKSP